MRKSPIGVGTFAVNNRARQLVNKVLDSGRISYGPMSRQFEKELSSLHGCEYGVLSNSGTSSLQVALQAMKELHGWRDGDEVIVPALTFVATANIVLHNRMTPVLVDVDAYTYNINPYFVEAAITPRTRAIIPVHLFGQPANMSKIEEIASVRGIKIIEDSCECMFANHNHQPVGSFGDIACFSTYVAHLITTGVGGMGITSNPDYAAKMRSLVNHGRDGIYISIDDNEDASPEVASRRFNFESVGHSFRVTELEAALGLAQLEGWEDMIATRRLNAAFLSERLDSLQDYIQLPVIGDANSHSFMMYPIVTYRVDKWGLVNHLEASGVETREMLPLTRQPCYKGMWRPEEYPIADWVNRGGFYIGCHQHLSREDLGGAAETIHDYYKV